MGVDACRLAEGEIEDSNLIESSIELVEATVVGDSKAQDASPGCQLLGDVRQPTS